MLIFIFFKIQFFKCCIVVKFCNVQCFLFSVKSKLAVGYVWLEGREEKSIREDKGKIKKKENMFLDVKENKNERN